MIEVQAVKDIDVVKIIPTLLQKHHSEQMSDIWTLGVNVALRISDLLSIKMSDIENDRVTLIESKTGKEASIKLNDTALATIKKIKTAHPDFVYLFQSYRSRRSINAIPKPITRQNVANAFKHVGEIVGVHLGTHSMRKTRGYHLYKKTGRIEPIVKMLRHSSVAVTLRYIGIDQEQIDDDFLGLEL
jgi:integrase